MNRRNTALDLLLGAAAGAAAIWLMDKATTLLYEREDDAAKNREESARGGRTAYENVAEKTAKLAGIELDDDRRKQIGNAIHWGIGIASGAVYGALRNRFGLRAGSGLLYALGMFGAMDEGLMYALHFTPPPQAFPWQTHARGAAGHLVFGTVIDSAFDLVDLAA